MQGWSTGQVLAGYPQRGPATPEQRQPRDVDMSRYGTVTDVAGPRSSVDRALPSGGRCRRFESCRGRPGKPPGHSTVLPVSADPGPQQRRRKAVGTIRAEFARQLNRPRGWRGRMVAALLGRYNRASMATAVEAPGLASRHGSRSGFRRWAGLGPLLRGVGQNGRVHGVGSRENIANVPEHDKLGTQVIPIELR